MQASTPAADGPVFNPTVEVHHERIDADAYGDIYVIVDIHRYISKIEK